LPSRYESFSYVLLEAMLHAKPCITTRAGAIPEVVGEDAAVLVSPGSEDMLADAIMKLIGDPTRRMELAAKGRERVIDRFDLTKTVDAVEMLFRTKVKTA
jgi:glycosyltransferase involved in cell wall biosynthesis